MTEPFWAAMALATLAGLSIPLGAALALWRVNILPGWAANEARHGIIAFGAGALLAAVALVLVPEGTARLGPAAALFWFAIGAVAFALIDRALAASGGQAAQFLAMMMDYLPEAMALGALIAGDYGSALLVAGLIALQNLPEGFNAMRELNHSHRFSSRKLMLLFALMVPLGPMSAWVGLMLPPQAHGVIGAVMMLSSGGILYLMFQDIAPQVRLENTWLPPLGAAFGFMLGLAGDLLI